MLRSQVVGRAMYTPPSLLDIENVMTGEFRRGDWRCENASGIVNLIHQGGNRHTNTAIALRNKWCEYFNTVGAVAWQERMVQ